MCTGRLLGSALLTSWIAKARARIETSRTGSSVGLCSSSPTMPPTAERRREPSTSSSAASLQRGWHGESVNDEAEPRGEHERVKRRRGDGRRDAPLAHAECSLSLHVHRSQRRRGLSKSKHRERGKRDVERKRSERAVEEEEARARLLPRRRTRSRSFGTDCTVEMVKKRG